MHSLHNTIKFQTNIYAGGTIMECELCNAYRVWCVYIHHAISLLWTVCSATGENHVSRAAHAQQLHVPHVCKIMMSSLPTTASTGSRNTHQHHMHLQSILSHTYTARAQCSCHEHIVDHRKLCNVETCIVNYIYYKMCLN